MIFYLIVIIGVFACSASQLLLKKSATIVHRSAIYELFNWRVIIAYGIMFATLISNIYAMSHGVLLKEMMALESLGFVFVPFLSFIVLKETISKRTIFAIAVILLGIFIFYL